MAAMRPWVRSAYGSDATESPIHAPGARRGRATRSSRLRSRRALVRERRHAGGVGRAAAADVRCLGDPRRDARADRGAARERDQDEPAVELLGRRDGRLSAAPVRRALRRRGDLGRGRDAQAGGADLPATRRPGSAWRRPSACSSTTSRATCTAAEAIGCQRPCTPDPVATRAALSRLLGATLIRYGRGCGAGTRGRGAGPGRPWRDTRIRPAPGRSANMRANRRTDTKPELALRSALHRPRLPLPQGLPARPGRRGQGPAGHRVHRAPGRRVRGRLLLARLPRARPRARRSTVVLGAQAAPQRGAGPGRGRRADRGRMAGGQDLGA